MSTRGEWITGLGDGEGALSARFLRDFPAAHLVVVSLSDWSIQSAYDELRCLQLLTIESLINYTLPSAVTPRYCVE